MNTRSAERIKDGRKVDDGFIYASDTNTEWMSKETLNAWISANQDKIGAI